MVASLFPSAPTVQARPLIRVVGLGKVYRVGAHTVQALTDVALDIAAGEFVAIMGPSGSGKSTFMNLLGCLDTPTVGTYWLDGEEVGHLARDARAALRAAKLGFVFQTFNLLPRMSAWRNVELPLVYAGLPSAERRARALARLREVGLEGREHHHPAQLSGGQQQRVAIARALVNEPRVILADEPTGNLDTRTSAEIIAVFQRLNRRGSTIVMVTHETDIARYTKRIVSFRDGRVVSDQPVASPLSAEAALETQPARDAA